jgi:toxin ParE1/3/4
MKVIVLHRVRPAILEAAQWYEDQRPGLGGEFLAAVDGAVLAIAGSPHRFPIVYHDARRAQLERFPYGVFYVLRHEVIHVFAVSPLAASPRKWQRAKPK